MSPRQRRFDFAAAFGGGSVKKKPYYNSRRVWRIQQQLTPSKAQSPDGKTFPLFLKPDAPINLATLAMILRDHYQNTQWDTAKNTAERPIGYFNTVHTDMIQLRANMPVEIGAVIWAGVGSSLSTPYTPYYFGVQEIPLPYRTAGKQPDKASAYWIFKKLADWLKEDLAGREGNIRREWKTLEHKLFQLQPDVERCALDLYRRNPERAGDYLTIYSGGLAWQALQTALKMRLER